jgi:ketosteroid isomerase-like protein
MTTETKTEPGMLETMVAAMNAGDLPRVLSFLDPDVVVEEPKGVPYAGTYEGHAGFQELIGKITSRFDLEITGVDSVDDGDLLVGRLHARFTARSTGATLETRIVEVDEVAEDVIRRIDVFYKDPELVTELWEQAD